MDERAIFLDKTGREIVTQLAGIKRALSGEKGTIYAFHVNGTESNPSDAVTYMENAVGMTPCHMDFTNGVFNWGSWKDAFFMPRPCMVKYDGSVDYYLSENDYTKKADGITASDIANASYAGNAMMEWGQNGKKIWMKAVPSSDKKSCTYYIADNKVDEEYHCWSFINNQGKEVDHFYTPIYNGSLVDGKLRSISGQFVSKSLNAQTEINYAKANNTGEDVLWNTEVYSDIILINALLILMGKSLNTQSVFGYGWTKYDSTDTEYYGMAKTGTMNDKGMFFGDSNGQTIGVKVFGMEHWWANQWRRFAGLVLVNGAYKVKLTYGKQDGSDTEGYNLNGAGYLDVGNIDITGTSGGYTKEMNFEEHGAMYPVTATGSSSTYFCDGFWFILTDTTYAFRGGGVDFGARCGASCLYLNGSASDAYWSIGAGVSLKPLA